MRIIKNFFLQKITGDSKETLGKAIVTIGDYKVRKRGMVVGLMTLWILIQSLLLLMGKIDQETFYKYTFHIFSEFVK